MINYIDKLLKDLTFRLVNYTLNLKSIYPDEHKNTRIIDEDNKMNHSRSVFRGSFVKQRGVEHGLLRVGGLLAAVLAEGGPALVVALELEVAGRGVVGAVVAGGRGDLALGPGAAVPAAAPLVTTSSQHGDKMGKEKSLHSQ